eukprot:jgi/Botrbrau1/19896/Bobra.0059s0017.1
MCAVGERLGVRIGRWWGPSTLCQTLESIVNKVRPGGLRVHLAGTPGGGVPLLCRPRVEVLLKGEDAESQDSGSVGPSMHVSPSSKSSAVLILIPLRLGLGKVLPFAMQDLQPCLCQSDLFWKHA